MGKRRNTAKTGDKGIYKAREQQQQQQEAAQRSHHDGDDDDDDPMYDVVDRHYRQKDQEFLKLDRANDDEDSEEEEEKEAVMDLGLGGGDDDDDDDDDEDSSDSSSDEDDDDDDDKDPKGAALPSSSSEDDDEENDEDDDLSDDDDDDDDDLVDQQKGDDEFVRDWGRKKTAYYHGDTADLELGQDEEDAFLEEEAAQQVQAARYEAMSEDDFVLSDDNDHDENAADDAAKTKQAEPETVSTTTSRIARDMSKLSARDRQKILDKQHPELLPLLSYFSSVVQELDESTNVATDAIFQGEAGTAESVGMSKPGKRYLLTKALLQTSTALNLAMYLLLKADNDDSDASATASIQNHPVMARLEKLNSLTQKLQERVEDKVAGLGEQLSNLVQAAALLNSGEIVASDNDDDDYDDDKDDDNDENASASSSSSNEGKRGGRSHQKEEMVDQEMDTKPAAAAAASSDDDDESDDNDSVAEEQRVLNEARFGLRAGEIDTKDPSRKNSKRNRPTASLLLSSADVGDDEEDDDLLGGGSTGTAATTARAQQQQKASRALASTLNTIEQKTNARKRRRAAPELLADGVDNADDDDSDDGELRAGLAMMEEEYGKDFDRDDDDDKESKKKKKTKSKTHDAELGDDNDFYTQIAQKSQSRKQFKKSLYAVAPKFPRAQVEVPGERALSQSILKNRGLVPHKNKDNRNPRVKKRKQYQKAVTARKGAVRQVRTDEGHKYGGEETGIKSGISRSRKLARG